MIRRDEGRLPRHEVPGIRDRRIREIDRTVQTIRDGGYARRPPRIPPVGGKKSTFIISRTNRGPTGGYMNLGGPRRCQSVRTMGRCTRNHGRMGTRERYTMRGSHRRLEIGNARRYPRQVACRLYNPPSGRGMMHRPRRYRQQDPAVCRMGISRITCGGRRLGRREFRRLLGRRWWWRNGRG